MATGFSIPLETGHDTVFEYCCTTCAHQNLNAEALFYCKDCRKLLCDECNKYHAKFFEGHRVLGRNKVADWGDVKPVTSSFIILCDEHPGKELEMYCEDHDVVCCYICISVKHRSCKAVQPVSAVSKGIRNKSEFQSFLSGAATTQSRLKTVYDKQENNIKMLQKARGEITATSKNMRQKFNQMVDRLEEESTTELDRLITILKEQVTIDQDACSDFINKIQKLLDDIQTLSKQCDDLAFQGYKKCSEQMANADKLLSSLQNVDFQIKFFPDSKIEELLYSLDTLGSFLIMPADHSDNFKYKGFAPLPDPPDHVYSVEKKQTYTVNINNYRDSCQIESICQLPGRLTAILDRDNSEVRLLSASTFRVLDELKLPSVPQDICTTTETELAVTVCLDDKRVIRTQWPNRFSNSRESSEEKKSKFITKEIQFINALYGKLSHTRTVQLNHDCYGIAYHSGQLYVGSCNSLYVYNLSGEKVKKIYEDISKKDDQTVSKCCLSDDGSRIYVIITTMIHRKNRLLTLDSAGNTLSTFSDPELEYPTDVCVAENGSVFVCREYSDIVLQVDREGARHMTTLATKDDKVRYPRCLCYDRKKNTLLVGQRGDYDNLLALQLQ